MAAFTPLLRRAATVAASRAVWRPAASSSPRRFSAAGLSTISHRLFTSPAISGSDQNMINIIKSEIQCAKDSNTPKEVEEMPEGFPFQIEDNVGDNIILLKRAYHGENITIEVEMPNIVTGEDNDDASAEDNDNKLSISLTVKISKGSDPCLVFSVTGYADELAIEDLAVVKENASEEDIAYEGPNFEDLDENLQKGFQKYLEMRDIKPSTINFLYEYMINKDSREYMAWLERLKKFIEK